MQFSMSLKEILEQYKINEKSLTENGAVSYKTSGKNLLDFNFKVSYFRNASEQEIMKNFACVFYENPKLAIKYLFYLMDIMQGLGERRISRICLEWLVNKHPEILEKIFNLIPEYNRWDTAIMLVDPKINYNESLRKLLVYKLKEQLYNDLNNYANDGKVSLLAKWLPSENASSKNTRRMARQLQQDFCLTARQYRKFLSKLRAFIDVTECYISSNNWNKIKYSRVPSKANLIYNNAFLRHDGERRRQYLQKVTEGKSTLNSRVLAPHEIVHKYVKSPFCTGLFTAFYQSDLELLWKGLENFQLKDVLVVRDGSGSMTSYCGNFQPLEVATAIAIYASEHNSPKWKDTFITFSENPKFINLKNCNSLLDKIEKCYAEDDYSNTDILKTMRLILHTAIKNNCKQNEIPATILIISDMQFDGGKFNMNKTLFENIQNEYKACGYNLPKIVFWNVAGTYKNTVPMQQNDCGLILISGFSTSLFEMVLSEEINPYKALIKILNGDRYFPVEKALQA